MPPPLQQLNLFPPRVENVLDCEGPSEHTPWITTLWRWSLQALSHKGSVSLIILTIVPLPFFLLRGTMHTELFPMLVALPCLQLAVMLVGLALATCIRADVWLQNGSAEYSLLGLFFLLSTSELTGLMWCDVADTALRAARGPCRWLIQARETWWG